MLFNFCPKKKMIGITMKSGFLSMNLISVLMIVKLLQAMLKFNLDLVFGLNLKPTMAETTLGSRKKRPI